MLYVLLLTAARVSTPDLCPAHDSVLFAGAHLRVGMLTAALPSSDNSGELVLGCAGDDREALRSFAHSDYVRRLLIA